MNEETEDQGSGIIEEGGEIRDWPAVDPEHRTWRSRVQREFERIITDWRERFGFVDPSPTDEVRPWWEQPDRH